jgi:hypothetical protein
LRHFDGPGLASGFPPVFVFGHAGSPVAIRLHPHHDTLGFLSEGSQDVDAKDFVPVGVLTEELAATFRMT